jgi:hypothetical protein
MTMMSLSSWPSPVAGAIVSWEEVGNGVDLAVLSPLLVPCPLPLLPVGDVAVGVLDVAAGSV